MTKLAILQDDDIMYFGKYKGMRLIDIDDDYFIYLYKKDSSGELNLDSRMKEYIESSFDEEDLK